VRHSRRSVRRGRIILGLRKPRRTARRQVVRRHRHRQRNREPKKGLRCGCFVQPDHVIVVGIVDSSAETVRVPGLMGRDVAVDDSSSAMLGIPVVLVRRCNLPAKCQGRRDREPGRRAQNCPQDPRIIGRVGRTGQIIQRMNVEVSSAEPPGRPVP
jgi:hypothetical protein